MTDSPDEIDVLTAKAARIAKAQAESGEKLREAITSLAIQVDPPHALGFLLSAGLGAYGSYLQLGWSEKHVVDLTVRIAERIAHEKESGERWEP